MGKQPFTAGKQQAFLAFCLLVDGNGFIGPFGQSNAAAELLMVNAAGGKVEGGCIKFHCCSFGNKESLDQAGVKRPVRRIDFCLFSK